MTQTYMLSVERQKTPTSSVKLSPCKQMLCCCVRSFENIQLEADNGIPTKPFLSSCSSILPFLGEFPDRRGCPAICVRVCLLSYCVHFCVVASEYILQPQTEGRWKYGSEICRHRPKWKWSSFVFRDNRPFATNDYMVQNPPCWRASSLLFLHWDIKTKASQA